MAGVAWLSPCLLAALSVFLTPGQCAFQRIASDDFMNGIRVLVEGTEIFQFSSPQPKQPLPLTGGKLPIKGQIIKFEKKLGFVTLCELQVDGCALGYYGGRCDSLCGKGCVNNNCNRQDGSCTCLTGWTSPKCTECDSGYYGVESCEECGYCSEGDVCNNTNGHCPRGCRDGFDGDRCDKCASNRWSSDCSLSCGQCAGDGSCYVHNGHCVNGCVQGFGGDNCTLEIVASTVPPQDGGNLTGPIVGGLLGAGALIGISVLLAAFMIIRRRRKSRDTPKPADTDSAHVSSEITPVRDVTEGDKPETETPGNESNYAQLERYENPDDIRPYSMLQDGGKLPKYINIQSD
ncbi:hypothetical protein BaRGS_00022246 [Batillaria attramentaria]|uniref:Laminin EGF-like domain-containing protein n=1 Tax=Batillaria attramentaria TaxID=370345 RepID=A0ABD0KHT9_9CAEN